MDRRRRLRPCARGCCALALGGVGESEDAAGPVQVLTGRVSPPQSLTPCPSLTHAYPTSPLYPGHCGAPFPPHVPAWPRPQVAATPGAEERRNGTRPPRLVRPCPAPALLLSSNACSIIRVRIGCAQGQLPPGSAFDLFRGAAPTRQDEVETYPTGKISTHSTGISFRIFCQRSNTPFGTISHAVWLDFPKLAC